MKRTSVVHYSILIILSLIFTSCGSTKKAIPLQGEIIQVQENPVPGTVNKVWIEPMYDTPRIPGQLDPTGTYYRLPHRSVIEVREHKFQKVEFPSDEPVNTQKEGNKEGR